MSMGINTKYYCCPISQTNQPTPFYVGSSSLYIYGALSSGVHGLGPVNGLCPLVGLGPILVPKKGPISLDLNFVANFFFLFISPSLLFLFLFFFLLSSIGCLAWEIVLFSPGNQSILPAFAFLYKLNFQFFIFFFLTEFILGVELRKEGAFVGLLLQIFSFFILFIFFKYSCTFDF